MKSNPDALAFHSLHSDLSKEKKDVKMHSRLSLSPVFNGRDDQMHLHELLVVHSEQTGTDWP